MELVYREESEVDFEELKRLFASVGWLNGDHPEQLKKAIDHSATVFTAWENGRLVGLVNAIDDRSLAVYVNYVLVHPDCQGRGIGRRLVELVKQKYAGFLYILLLAENEQGAGFYETCGFQKSPCVPMVYNYFEERKKDGQ